MVFVSESLEYKMQNAGLKKEIIHKNVNDNVILIDLPDSLFPLDPLDLYDPFLDLK